MSTIRQIRTRIALRLSASIAPLPPLFLPMLVKETRNENNLPFQPLYAEAVAPRLSAAPQSAYRRQGRSV